MDIRAFGTVYGQQNSLPMASGFLWKPADGEKRFATCRAVFIEAKASSGKDDVYVELNDGPGQLLHVENLVGDQKLDWGLTAISGGSIEGAIVLY
jgi:hypothetical protein